MLRIYTIIQNRGNELWTLDKATIRRTWGGRALEGPGDNKTVFSPELGRRSRGLGRDCAKGGIASYYSDVDWPAIVQSSYRWRVPCCGRV